MHLQRMGVDLESSFEVQRGRADVTGPERALGSLDFLDCFGRDPQFAHRNGVSKARQARLVSGNERMREWFGLCANSWSQNQQQGPNAWSHTILQPRRRGEARSRLHLKIKGN